jgi:hypothetical protein
MRATSRELGGQPATDLDPLVGGVHRQAQLGAVADVGMRLVDLLD